MRVNDGGTQALGISNVPYFDYFLKDAPEPDWMERGVPYLEKGKRDVSVFYKKSTDGKSGGKG